MPAFAPEALAKQGATSGPVTGQSPDFGSPGNVGADYEAWKDDGRCKWPTAREAFDVCLEAAAVGAADLDDVARAHRPADAGEQADELAEREAADDGEEPFGMVEETLAGFGWRHGTSLATPHSGHLPDTLYRKS